MSEHQIIVKGTHQFCHIHRDVDALYQCSKCLEPLCEECVDRDTHNYLCSQCGGIARRVVSVTRERVSLKETATDASGALKGVMHGLVNHIIIPIAIIVMVSAFMFYLLDIRSVYWLGGASLKRIGFFFVAAVVLIARYGKVHAHEERQAVYTGILALATLFAMLRETGFGMGFIVNILVISIVWRFATGVTNRLDLEDDGNETYKPEEIPLYGVARLHHEEMEKKHHLQQRQVKKVSSETPVQKKKGHKGWKRILIPEQDPHGNASGSVARLAGLAIVVFALGEPIILAGPPEVGYRAMIAVMVFLLSTGVVLAAASAAGTFHHAVLSGGKVSLGMVPVKIGMAVILVIVVLAMGLGVPGIRYEGSGKIKPPAQSQGKGSIRGQEDKKGDTGGENQNKEPESRQKGTEKEGNTKSPDQSGVTSIFNLLMALGKLILIPVVIFFIGFILYALYKILPVLREQGLGIGDRLRRWLEKWRARLRSSGKERVEDSISGPDPLSIMGKLSRFPPREAIIGAYQCLLAFFQRAGHKTMPRQTPYEILSSLPYRLSHLTEPARLLTDIYVNTAYSPAVPTIKESNEAIKHLFHVKQLLESKPAQV